MSGSGFYISGAKIRHVAVSLGREAMARYPIGLALTSIAENTGGGNFSTEP